MNDNHNNSYSEIVSGIGRIERRLRLHEAARLAPLATAVALGASILMALVDRFSPLLPLPQMLLLDALLLIVALLSVTLYALLRPRKRLATARRGDAVLDLQERLATAVEDQESGHVAKLAPAYAATYAKLQQAQLQDTASSLAGALPNLPLRLTLAPERRSLLLPVALLVVLAASFLLPNPATAFFEQKEVVQEQQQEEAQKIEEIRKELATLPTDATTEALAAELAQLEDDLAQGDMSREEAVARLSEAEAQLQQLVDQQAPGQQAALDSLGRQLSEQQGPIGKAGEALQQGDTEKAADALNEAAQNADQMTPEERQALANTLREAAADVANNDPSLAQQLNEAAQALEGGDSQASQQALENLSDEVRQSGQNIASQQQLEQALAQIQESKGNIAQAGTPNGTPMAGGTPLSGTPLALNGTPLPGTAISGTPLSGTAVAMGSPVSGTLSLTGTPVIVQGQGTPIAGQGNQPGQGNQQGQTTGNGNGNQPGNNSSNQAGSGHQEPVSVPAETLNAQGTPVGVQARPGEGDTSVTGVNTNPSGGSSNVPYEEVYGTYNQSAQETLEEDYIPAGMKDLVRRYFTDIDPNKK